MAAIEKKKELAAVAAEAARDKMIAEAQKNSALIKAEQDASKKLALEKAEAERLAQADQARLANERERQENIRAAQEAIAEKARAEKALQDMLQQNQEAERLAKIQARAKQIQAERTEKAANLDNETKKVLADNKPDRCAIDINGVIKSSINGRTISDATVDIYFSGENIESLKSDANGNFHFRNFECNTVYTIISFKEEIDDLAKYKMTTGTSSENVELFLETDIEYFNYYEQQAADNPDKKEIVDESSIKKPKEELIEAPKVVLGKVEINPIYFDLDEYYLTLPSRRELDKIIVLMRLRPTLIIESGSHTDTQGDFDYNLVLSEKRSQETVGYLIANGVDPDRISGRGYGETMPINHCLDGVKCSDQEHKMNRRTEFMVLRY